MSEIVRVLRVLEYVGTREMLETTLARSIHGVKVIEKDGKTALTIKAATLGLYPEILDKLGEDNNEKS